MRPFEPPPWKWTPPTPEERAAELARAEREARRAELKLYAIALLLCFTFTLIGCIIAGFGFAVNDVETGQILLYSGLLVSNIGNVASLGWLAIRVDRGDV